MAINRVSNSLCESPITKFWSYVVA